MLMANGFVGHILWRMKKDGKRQKTNGHDEGKLSPRIENRRARFDYEVFESVEAGIALLGSEVKSVRKGRVQLAGSFAIVRGRNVVLVGCHIEEYEQANRLNHDPTRWRNLLLHRREIRRLSQELAKQPGLTLVPLEIYFKHGYAKVRLALAKGKTKFDKRQAIKDRDARRQMDRAMRRE
jgi:SsrA-binding protein